MSKPYVRKKLGRPCKKCGKDIIFAKTAKGKLVPLDTTVSVFMAQPSVDEEGRESWNAEFIQGAYVSHFSTCPAADEFSASKKKSAEQTEVAFNPPRRE
jgi:hypothetical protein